MNSKKVLFWSLMVGTAGLAGFFIFKYLKGPVKVDVPQGKKITPATATSPSDFPIKVGSKGALVKQLQALLGVTADGIFGPKTLAALTAKTGKLSIASQAEFNTVISNLSTALAASAAANAKSAAAQKLVTDFKNNPSWNVRIQKAFTAYLYNMDAYGIFSYAGTSTKLKAGGLIERARIDFLGVGSSGNIRVKIQAPDESLSGYYLFDPSDITLSA